MSIFRKSVEHLIGRRIFRILPRGTEILFDLNRFFEIENFKTVFDVGANVGQTSLEYASFFRGAHITAFEPVSSTYRQLNAKTAANNRIRTINMGLSDSTGENTIHLHETSDTNSFDHMSGNSIGIEKVKTTTLDEYCETNNVDRIDFLKIDVEGHEKHVLRGASRMLEQKKVALIQAEVMPFPTDGPWVAMPEINSLLHKNGFQLFGIYNQEYKRSQSPTIIKYVNAVFILPEASVALTQQTRERI